MNHPQFVEGDGGGGDDGGDGGSVISIVKKSEIDSITDIIGNKFLKKFNVSPDFIECLVSDGTRRVKFQDVKNSFLRVGLV